MICRLKTKRQVWGEGASNNAPCNDRSRTINAFAITGRFFVCLSDYNITTRQPLNGEQSSQHELCLSFALTSAHACFNDIDYIVAELLAFAHDVHVHSTDGICVLMVIDIVDVLRAQLVAIVVDFVLNVE